MEDSESSSMVVGRAGRPGVGDSFAGVDARNVIGSSASAFPPGEACGSAAGARPPLGTLGASSARAFGPMLLNARAAYAAAHHLVLVTASAPPIKGLDCVIGRDFRWPRTV